MEVDPVLLPRRKVFRLAGKVPPTLGINTLICLQVSNGIVLMANGIVLMAAAYGCSTCQ